MIVSGSEVVALPGQWIVRLVFGENGPAYPCMLVGDRNERFVIADSMAQIDDPLFNPRAFLRCS